MLWPDVRQRRKTGLLFESSLNHVLLKVCSHFKCNLETLCLLYDSFCSCSQLNFPHKLMFRSERWGAEKLALIFSNHLAHSQFQSGPLWKWHKLLFSLQSRTVPLLLFSSGDYWANLGRINGGGEGIPFVQWEHKINTEDSAGIMLLTFRLPWAFLFNLTLCWFIFSTPWLRYSKETKLWDEGFLNAHHLCGGPCICVERH